MREPGVSDVHQARVLVRHARVAASSVEVSRSVYWADEAIKLAPRDPEVVHASLRVLIEADELARAQQGPDGAAARGAGRPRRRRSSRPSWRCGRATRARGARRSRSWRPRRATLIESTVPARPPGAARRQHRGCGSAFSDGGLGRAAARPRGGRVRRGCVPREDDADAARAAARKGARCARPDRGARADLRALALARGQRAGRARPTRRRGRGPRRARWRSTATTTRRNCGAGCWRSRTARADAGRVDLLAVYERTGGFAGLLGPLSRLYIRSGELRALEAMVQPHLSDDAGAATRWCWRSRACAWPRTRSRRRSR